MKRIIVIACSILVVAIVQGKAEAAYWQITGNGCVWDTSFPTPYTGGNLVTFQNGSTNTYITVTCPITAVNLNGVRPHIAFYINSTSTTNSFNVNFYRMAKGNGFTGSPQNICSYSTSAYNQGYKYIDISIWPATSCFTDTFDTSTYIYWARVDISRTNTSLFPSFQALELY